jgi:hypothetical protein
VAAFVSPALARHLLADALRPGSSVTGSQRQSAARDLAVGRLDDLGGFPDCPVPDSGVRVGEGSFGGAEPGCAVGRRSMAMAAPQRWGHDNLKVALEAPGDRVK